MGTACRLSPLDFLGCLWWFLKCPLNNRIQKSHKRRLKHPVGDTTVSPMKKLVYLIILSLTLWTGIAHAQDQPKTDTARRFERPLKRPGGYGAMLFKMVLALVITCILAFVILKWGMRKLVNHTGQDAQMRVLARLPIEPRRSVIVVKVSGRTLVLGSSESGVELLTELHGADAASFVEDATKTTHQKRAFSLPEPQAPEAQENASSLVDREDEHS